MINVRLMMARIFALLAVSATFCQTHAEELAGIARKAAADAIDSGRAVGISIGIAQGDEILLAEGYGLADLESKVPATAETVYRIGSITKQFTAVAILQLAQRDRLGLDDELTKHLQDYPAHQPPVTIRQLLQHTSGIQSLTDLPSYRRLMREDVSHDQMIARFKDLPYHFDPGTRFKYCNSGYYLLGVVVESAAETTFDKYLQENVFKPLRLDHTYYDRAQQMIPNRASGYRRGLDGFQNAPYVSMTQPFAAGALASTVTDLIRWQRGLVDHKLIDEASYRMMTTRGALIGGEPIDYGMGVFLRKSVGRQTITHGGGINGFRSDLAYYPDSDHTIVVLTNSANAKPGQISKQLAQHLFAEPTPNQD